MNNIQNIKQPLFFIKQNYYNNYDSLKQKFVYGACQVLYDEFSNILECHICLFLFDFLHKINRRTYHSNVQKYFGTVDKIKAIARCYSHEYIHYLLFQEHGTYASETWDNLEPEIKNCFYHHSG